jgi:thiol-disulfide isomerase/thioredoxin
VGQSSCDVKPATETRQSEVPPVTKGRRGLRGRFLAAWVASGLAILAVAAALWVWKGPGPQARSSPTTGLNAHVSRLAGKPAPPFVLPILSGSTHASDGRLALRDLRGRPVVLNFWASWCAPCRNETPMLVRMHKRYKPQGVVFVGVDVEDQAADARRFLARYHVDYTIVTLSGERLLAAYAVPGLPTTVFIDPDGVIRGRHVGGFAGRSGERALAGELDRLLRAGQ